jgi:hypothetical protein
MASRKVKPGPNQELLLSEFEPRIPTDTSEWPARAQQAAYRRFKRVGAYALTSRTKGFRQAVRNLWIPYSAGENTDVTSVPEVKIVQDRYAAKQRVFDKYDETDIDPRRLRKWANFSAHATERQARTRFREYRQDARKQRVFLAGALAQPELTYSRDSIMANDFTLGALQLYLINLKSFNGQAGESGAAARRKWVQRRWTNVMARERQEAQAFLDSQISDEFHKLYDEAFFNSWCREQYWAAVQQDHELYLKAMRQQPPPLLEVPLRVYEQGGLFIEDDE